MLKIYNTLHKRKETFRPIHANKVGIYVCGITTYDYCHVGHARTNVSADIIVRYLRFKGFEVNYVRNITDVDDKIIKRAKENHETIQSLTQRFIQAMYDDFDALKILPPDHEPLATEYIGKMISLIENLLQNNQAYIASNGDIYFDIKSYKKYGKLSHSRIEELESGARVEINDVKRDPLDFVLWKIAKADEPAWASPWGDGRPGWHTECAAMALDLLGDHFDIHGGGRDLMFPHHENEIAQAESFTHVPFANVWIHGGFVQIEKEKMSKSLGNFITIRDVLQHHSPEVLRYVLISSHYRSPLIYSEELLVQAKLSLTRLYTALRYLPPAEAVQNSVFEKEFMLAMDDDFNTPIALSVLFELAHEIQRMREAQEESKAARFGALLSKLANVLGILTDKPDDFFQASLTDINVTEIESLIAQREQARIEKNWVLADQIRQKLKSMAIILEDGPKGTTWKME